MIEFEQSQVFSNWLGGLKDIAGKARIIARLRSAEHGNFGDCEPVGNAVYEMRIHSGPGYRVYFSRQGSTFYLLLAGGDKSTQKRDIARATQIALNMGNEE